MSLEDESLAVIQYADWLMVKQSRLLPEDFEPVENPEGLVMLRHRASGREVWDLGTEEPQSLATILKSLEEELGEPDDEALLTAARGVHRTALQALKEAGVRLESRRQPSSLKHPQQFARLRRTIR